MSSETPVLHQRVAPPVGRSLSRVIPSAILMLFFAGALVLMVDKIAPSAPLVVVGGTGLLGLTWLAVIRYETAAALGFLLFGVVKIEPAPPDAVFAVVIAVALATGRFRIDRVPLPILALVAMLLTIDVLSFVSAISLSRALRFELITVYMAVFGLWLIGFVDRTSRAMMIARLWLIVGVFSALLGTLALQFPGFPARATFIFDASTRASALFKDPNVYGPFLVPIAVILLEDLINPRIWKMKNITRLLLFTILIIGLIFSFSRAAWANCAIATGVMLLIVVLRGRHNNRVAALVAALAIVGGLVFAFLLISGKLTFIGQRAQIQGYDTNRFDAWGAGIKLAEHYPLGVGPDNFIVHHPIEAHSTYIRVLAEQGYVGLIIWICLIVTTLIFAIGNAFQGRDTFVIGSASLMGAWCGLLWNSVVVDTLHWRHLWLVAGLIWVGWIQRSDREDPGNEPAEDDLPEPAYLGPGTNGNGNGHVNGNGNGSRPDPAYQPRTPEPVG